MSYVACGRADSVQLTVATVSLYVPEQTRHSPLTTLTDSTVQLQCYGQTQLTAQDTHYKRYRQFTDDHAPEAVAPLWVVVSGRVNLFEFSAYLGLFIIQAVLSQQYSTVAVSRTHTTNPTDKRRTHYKHYKQYGQYRRGAAVGGGVRCLKVQPELIFCQLIYCG